MSSRPDLSKPAPGLYVGKLPCGCVVAACADRPELKRDTADVVAEWIAEGLTVSYRENDGKNPFLDVCGDHPHDAKPKAKEVPA